MKYTHVLWDFNGTILDDVETGILSINNMLKKRGLPIINSKTEYRNHFCFPITSYYKSLGFDFTKEPFETLAQEWVELYLKYVKYAKLRNGVIETLSSFRKSGLFQYIVSATEYNMLGIQLENLGILKCFDGYIGLDNIHASSKTLLAKHWYDQNKPEKPVIIGDTVHDFEVAEILKCDCILVSGGHQSRNVLDKCNTNVVDSIYKVRDLVLG